MHTARSARRVCSAPASAVENTATASIPSSCSARITRTATSPRFATRTLENIPTVRPRTSLAMSVVEAVPAVPARPSYARPPNTRQVDLSQRVERTSKGGLELEEKLAEFDRRRVLDVDRP